MKRMDTETIHTLFKSKIAQSELVCSDYAVLCEHIQSNGELVTPREENWWILYEPKSDLTFAVPESSRGMWLTTMFDEEIWETSCSLDPCSYHAINWELADYLREFISEMRSQYSELAE